MPLYFVHCSSKIISIKGREEIIKLTEVYALLQDVKFSLYIYRPYSNSLNIKRVKAIIIFNINKLRIFICKFVASSYKISVYCIILLGHCKRDFRMISVVAV